MALPEGGLKREDEQINLAMKQSITRRQTPEIYQARLQTIMKIAGGQKDPESRWWELRSVIDDYEWLDMQEMLPDTFGKNKMHSTQSEPSTTTMGMTGESSSSSAKVNASTRRLSSEQEQMIETNRVAAALKKQKLQQTWL